MPIEAHPSLASLFDAASSGSLTTAPPFEAGKALRKSLASTGYLVERFLSACDTLLTKVKAGRMPELAPYFHGFDFTTSPILKGEGLFVCTHHLNGNRLKLQPLLLNQKQATQVLHAWHLVQLDAPAKLPDPLEIPSTVNSTLWPALLHLRPLLNFWEQELRRNHVETLLERVPHAWILDPAPLPPGAAIPKLELASWNQLTPTDNFTIRSLVSDHNEITLDPSLTAQEWQNHINQSLLSFTNGPQVLSESPSKSDAILLGTYQRQNERVECIGGIALHQDEHSTSRLSRW